MAGVRFPAWESILFFVLFSSFSFFCLCKCLFRNNSFFPQRFHRKIEIKAPNQLIPATNDTSVVENVYTFAATPIHQEIETSQTAYDAELNTQDGNAIVCLILVDNYFIEESPLEEEFISYNELQLNRISNQGK